MVIGTDAFSADPARHWQRGKIAITGGHLVFHRTGGPGQPLVLAHGLTDNGLCWARVAVALQDEYDIVMLDARGHGESSRIARGAASDRARDIAQGAASDPARDIAQAIATLDLRSPVVMGHSIGALAIATFASANPAVASKIILEDPPFLPIPSRSKSLERKRMFRQQVEEFQRMTDAEIHALGRQLSPGWHEDEFPAWTLGKQQVDPAAMPERFAPWQEAVVGIAVPTLMICGETERGGLVSRAVAAEAMRINRNIQSVTIEGAGHNIHREQFAAFITHVRAFLKHDSH